MSCTDDQQLSRKIKLIGGSIAMLALFDRRKLRRHPLRQSDGPELQEAQQTPGCVGDGRPACGGTTIDTNPSRKLTRLRKQSGIVVLEFTRRCCAQMSCFGRVVLPKSDFALCVRGSSPERKAPRLIGGGQVICLLTPCSDVRDGAIAANVGRNSGGNEPGLNCISPLNDRIIPQTQRTQNLERMQIQKCRERVRISYFDAETRALLAQMSHSGFSHGTIACEKVHDTKDSGLITYGH